MIKFEQDNTYGLDIATLGARNSWNSHNKSDSYYTEKHEFVLGENDLKLLLKLCKAGASHAKFMRQIMVSVNITGPLYWWKQFDQYKVGTTTNSESTMHTINRTGFFDENGRFNEKLFSFDYEFYNELYSNDDEEDYLITTFIDDVYQYLEKIRLQYNNTKDKRYWDLLIALLPSGFNQMRTTTMNYAVLANIYHDRKNHKLSEWHDMCDWIETLPYSELITGGNE